MATLVQSLSSAASSFASSVASLVLPARADAPSTAAIRPLSVNYHFQRQCNYRCGFCFHTATTADIASLDEAKRAMRLLRDAGMQKINFAGGEPFLFPEFLGALCRYCKEDLGLAVSIVSNGSLITRAWLEAHADVVDMLAVSCDSFREQTNRAIGRTSGGASAHIPQVRAVAEWCHELGIRFKINTVVCKPNKDEDMIDEIRALNPYRWKVFQVLCIDGENSGPEAKRNARRYAVTDDEFAAFIERHRALGGILKPESNTDMRNSYLILDEYLRFLNCSDHTKRPTRSLNEVSDGDTDAVQAILHDAGWDQDAFVRRGGHYDWSRNAPVTSCGSKALEW